MSDTFKEDFRKSLDTGFIDQQVDSNVLYRPKLVINKTIPKEISIGIPKYKR